MTNPSLRLQRQHTALVIVDVQERLLPAMSDRERLLENIVRLAKGAACLNIPVFVSEQYRKGLGATVPAVASAVAGFAPIEKLAFSACGEPRFLSALKTAKAEDVVLCGIEAHVCVTQTCLDLLGQGFRVFAVADAVSSRTQENARYGIDRLRQAGAVIVSTEMVLFELLEKAGTEEFKQILALVK